MKDLQSFIQYFEKEIAENYKEPSLYFVHGAVDGILMLLTSQTSKIEYPALTLETPSYGVSGVQKTTLKPETAIAVLYKVPKDDYKVQTECLAKSFEIIMDIWDKILFDTREENGFGFRVEDKEYPLTPVAPMGADFIVGHRLEFSIRHTIHVCKKNMSDKWKKYGKA